MLLKGLSGVSSVEDPITEAPRIRTPARARVVRKELPAPTSTTITTVAANVPDYSFYIRIIICLLGGLLLLNTLLLFRVNNIESQPTLGDDVAQVLRRLADQGKSHEQTVALENLLEKVNQLASELQKLKQQISQKQEL
ncbi:unnamed protein product [Strongylus vulgaris]|uniref:Uncharacterized protein n=1 Tax=Strongylus vulgaris TaxID=40348 RepID=A0A3P7JQC8_STRVU|nr:unnamed protein product [Strongylus vulgaris]